MVRLSPKNPSRAFVEHLLQILLLMLITMVLPGGLVVLLLFQIHRQIIARLLAAMYGSSFRGLLEGPDVVWAGEKHSSRAMINVLFLFENTNKVTDASSELLQELCKRVKCHLQEEVYQKMLWELHQKWGYYFWLHRQSFLPENYVRNLKQIGVGDGCISRRELCQLLGSISSQECKGTSWELLVGKQPVAFKTEGATLYPVLLRFHHSISDGIAIFRLFRRDFFDDCGTIKGEQIDEWNPNDANKVTLKSFTIGYRLLKLTLTAPKFLMHELVFKRERNHFHYGAPSMNKITSWASELPSDTSLISTIKKVKLLLVGVSFTDVFLTAFAMSLRSYCKARGHIVPTSLTLGVMRRFKRETKEIQLRNRSTAVFQTLPVGELPITGPFPSCSTVPNLLEQIRAVKKHSDILLASTDPLTTFLSVAHLPELLPAPIVRALLKKGKFSVGFSNIPAFETAVTVRGCVLKDATFWVPNIMDNMLGLSILTVVNRLHVGLIADRRIIPQLDELDSILEGTMLELHNMANILKCFNL